MNEMITLIFLSLFIFLWFAIKLKTYFPLIFYLTSFCQTLGIWEYIEKTRNMVHDLEKRVRQAKNNVETMNSLMTKWCETPLYERKDGKKELLLNLEVLDFGLHFSN